MALAVVREDLGPGPALHLARSLVTPMIRSAGQSQFSSDLVRQTHDSACEFAALHDWLRDNLAVPISVGDMAERCSMNDGQIAALTFEAAVDAPARFKRSRTVAAHFGLTQRRYQSGEHDNPGRISRAGDRDVRSALYAAANALRMRTMAGSQIKSWGMRLMRTKGRRRAIVAVARKLAVLLHRMWADGTEFRPVKVEGTS